MLFQEILDSLDKTQQNSQESLNKLNCQGEIIDNVRNNNNTVTNNINESNKILDKMIYFVTFGKYKKTKLEEIKNKSDNYDIHYVNEYDKFDILSNKLNEILMLNKLVNNELEIQNNKLEHLGGEVDDNIHNVKLANKKIRKI